LGLRLWTLQILQAPAAVSAVTANQIRPVSIVPPRGLILDRYGNPLVNNVSTTEITLSRNSASRHNGVIGRLAALIGETEAQVNASIANTKYSLYEPIPILANAPVADVLYIKEHPAEFPGVATDQISQRNYPQLEYPGPAQDGYPASQVLGYVGVINGTQLASHSSNGYQAGDPFGQAGLEQQYESVLHGTPGQQQLEVDSTGHVVGTLKTTPAVPGDNLVTNIDTPLQQVADNALATQIGTLRNTLDPACNNNTGCYPAATGGAVLVMDPRSGAVLASSSFPSYNPNIWVGGISNAAYAAINSPTSNYPQLNRAIEGVFTPGSTFKLNTATAALDAGLWTPTETYDDTGTFKVPGCKANSGATGCVLQNAPGDGALGSIDIATALTVSDDDFFYNLGALFYDQSSTYGETPIQNVAGAYSLGQLTGIDLPGETTGRVDSQPERQKLHAQSPTAFPNTTWYTGDNVEMAFGQGGTVITPIEQAVAYSTFVNGGTRYAPQVAAAEVAPSGAVVKRIAPQVTGHVSLPASTYQPMLAGFEGVVQSPHGTGYGAFQGSLFPVNLLAGKTGTADTVAGKEPTSWFVGFTTTPQYVVVCVIDQAGYGATAAAPVVRDIFDYLAAHPVGPAAIPPGNQVIQATKPVSLIAPTTTTTTTTPGSGTGSGTTTTTAGTG
ncbi:MAG TPA: penicillin-binding transpeptidase domain-containing protein, partial [Acidimicrobiales bacterium]|nr:penicillin-binding transpeptidase domain-containing protein [Acidimicrobiales bacterium]